MFSFGIFTTHIPYIIMIVFYAYFLIFGVERASNEENVSENFLKIEIEKENINFQSAQEYNYFYQNDLIFFKSAVFEKLEVLKYPGYLHPVYIQDTNCYSRFSRPPPKA